MVTDEKGIYMITNLFRSHRLISGLMTGMLLVMIAGCHKSVLNLQTMTPEEQFIYAKRLFDRKDYYNARIQFTRLVLANPGASIVESAQYYLSETYFKMKEYIVAAAEYEKLIRRMPDSHLIDDARYKIGLCYFELAPGYGLDQEYTKKAITQFELFLEDYPDSDLVPKVEQKMKECQDKLARKEYKTGELYRKMNYYRAALISYNLVLEEHPESPYVDDALYWKGYSQLRLRQWDGAVESFTLLRQEFPASPYQDEVDRRIAEAREKKAYYQKYHAKQAENE